MNSEAREITVSNDNLHSFIETGLKSMKLISDSDIVFGISYDYSKSFDYAIINIKKEV